MFDDYIAPQKGYQGEVNPEGCYLDLYQDDFESTRIWRDICEVIGTSPDQDHVLLLAFEVKKRGINHA